jgi:hypothetical protein
MKKHLKKIVRIIIYLVVAGIALFDILLAITVIKIMF